MRTQRFAGEPLPLLNAAHNPNERLLPGTEVLGGRYVVERVLGKGGMGVVVAARHKALGRRDAIKFLLPELITNDEILERFKREAQAAGNLKSAHVAHVYDSGFTESGEPYIVMEYLEGHDLKSVLLRGPLPIDDTVEYLLQICRALAEAHKNRVVHRDLKPANLFLTFPENGLPQVKVLDFGIAKLLDGEPVTDITVEDGKGGFLGTIPYMSPEHLRGAKKVDERTDIWALGVIAYELLTCKKPFNGLTKLDLVSKILDKDEYPDPPSKVCRGLPPAIEMVIGRCLAKNREARYQTVQEFEAALRAAAGIPAPPPMRPRMSSTTDGSFVSAQFDHDKPRDLTHGKTRDGFTATNPVPSLRSGHRKAALAGTGALATSVAVIGLVVALRGAGGEQAVGHANAGLAMAMSGNGVPVVVPAASASGAPTSDVAIIEMEEAGKTAPPSMEAKAEKTTSAGGIKKPGSGGKTDSPPAVPAPAMSAPPIPQPKPKETATAAPTFTPPPGPDS